MAGTMTHTHSAADRLGPCECGDPCQANAKGLERTRFFPSQLVTPDDFTQDQLYFREKLRRHNRMLHGWGVVCGACVRRGRGACEVIVEPGYVLGPYGDEIVIAEPITIDICKQGLGERTGCCGEELDPWCADVRADCPEGRLYLAVRYSECHARPVRAMSNPCGCGCDDSACEYSRIRDSYTLKILTELPSTYTDPLRQPNPLTLVPCLHERTGRRCPPCPAEPWVILADIIVDRSCSVRQVDCFAHRRYVVSFADFFFTCARRPGETLTTQPVTNLAATHFMSMMTGGTTLMDVGMATSVEAPRATVTMRRADGSPAMIPAYFTVQPGETVADLLEREGGREYFDPQTGGTVTLRELYEGTGVAMDAQLEGTAAALAPLEGRVLGGGSGGGAVPARAELEELLDRRGRERLDRELGGAPQRARELPANTLTGVAPGSPLGGVLERMTIGDVAAMDREAFLARAAELAPKNRRREVRRQATEVWQTAERVARLGGGGSEGGGEGGGGRPENERPEGEEPEGGGGERHGGGGGHHH